MSVVGGDGQRRDARVAAGGQGQGQAGEGCRNDVGGAAQPSPAHDPRAGTLVPSSQLMEASASAVVQFGPCGSSSSCTPPSSSSAVSFGSSWPFMFGAVGVDEALAPGGVDEDVPVGVLDVVGERLARSTSRSSGGCSSGTFWYSTPKGFQNAAICGRRARPEVPVRPELLLVGGQAGHGVAAGVDGRLDEDDALGQPGGAQVALQGDERAGHERALVLAQRQEGREHDHLAAQRGQRHGLALLVHQRARAAAWAG